MNKLMGVILLSTALTSCQVKRQAIIGKYEWQGTYGVGASMELQADSSFHYHWQQGLLFGETFGQWRLENGQLILQSEYQSDANGATYNGLLEKTKTESDYWQFEIVDRDLKRIPFSSCKLKKGSNIIKQMQFDVNGYLKTSKIDADSIIIETVAYQRIACKIDQENSNYKFQTYSFPMYYRAFKNEKWSFRKNKLIDPELRSNKHIKMKYYKKVK